MNFLKKNLLIQIIIAIGLGSVLGNYLPEEIGRVFSTFNSIFGDFLGFAIPLIIIGLIVPAIGNIGKNAGRLLLITTAIAYGSTLFAGLISYGVSISTFPNLLNTGEMSQVQEATRTLKPYFSIEMPPLFDVMSALIISFVLGIGISKNNLQYLEGVFNDFQKVIMALINKAIIPFLPLFIFGIFLNMTYNGQVFVVLDTFIKIIGVIFILHIFVLVFQYVIAGIIGKQNPFKLMKNMLPAYFTALGTQSSAATIPVTLKQTLANNVDPKIAGFTIPLCATIHLSGSTLKIVACAIALMLVQGEVIEFGEMIGFICMLGVAMVAAPGVPGGAIMASLGVLSSILGFNTEQQSLMIALYIAMDSFGTACNVMGDGAIAIIVNRIGQNKVAAS
ncbi:dicarboxylate/amino acid:cation symporter [Myroides pelagicus]|uniref:Cation:dicarboxylase symporter family transporter n=1 Tax=Myroides pelagicus TaxID=270914 RepID=A0A7K1GKZ4_9FLAO|nr:dicarboxylate/amino acid:cation symporter [Myroides pelagicus]MEC4112601.1 dicarboxylate/amino acid:cation symporter [Myroides pelagicus]MTH29521.1 cation:dicarboxylase symporter family transporter [Myroides pelagicus]